MRPIQLEERQLVRPDGTVLVQVTIPANVRWAPDLRDRIAGPCLVRVRDLPDGKWEVIAQFPDGYPPSLDG